jgi:hypothetical protein
MTCLEAIVGLSFAGNVPGTESVHLQLRSAHLNAQSNNVGQAFQPAGSQDFPVLCLQFGHFSADANGVNSYQPRATPWEKCRRNQDERQRRDS